MPFPVLVNGQRVTVQAVHARGTFDDLKVEFLFLDDPDNPLALKWSTGTTAGALQVVQITYPIDQATPQIEQALKQSGRAEVHGIYFDFASATIKPESEAVLRRSPTRWPRTRRGRCGLKGTPTASAVMPRTWICPRGAPMR